MLLLCVCVYCVCCIVLLCVLMTLLPTRLSPRPNRCEKEGINEGIAVDCVASVVWWLGVLSLNL